MLNFRISKEDRDRLERLVEGRPDLSRSEVMRAALARYLAAELQEAPKAS